jgi:hypothetical protein
MTTSCSLQISPIDARFIRSILLCVIFRLIKGLKNKYPLSLHAFGHPIPDYLRYLMTLTIFFQVPRVQSEWEKSQSHVTTDGKPVSQSWCRAPSRAHDQIFSTVRQLEYF